MALVEQNTFLRAFEGFVERHIVKEDVGGFAAQLQGGGNQHFGGGNADVAADFGRTGKGKFVEAFMVQHVFAGFRTAAGNHVQHAFRQQVVDFFERGTNRLNEVLEEGWMTMVQPAANAGAIFHAAIKNGKFQGMIWPTTPIGSRRTMDKSSASSWVAVPSSPRITLAK